MNPGAWPSTAPALSVSELLDLGASRRLSTLFGCARGVPSIVVQLDGTHHERLAAARADGEVGLLPAVLIGVGAADDPAVSLVDVVVDTDRLADVTAAIADRPVAATALALLLRHGDERSTSAGLIAESATYSTLQAGAEFTRWRASRELRPRPLDASEPSVVVERDAARTTITLSRPHRHNAVDTALAEELVEALTQALDRPDDSVILRGAGPSFCSGGDLDDFGRRPDPAIAHVARLARSAGHLVSLMRERVHVELHGACMGAGIELPAFAGRLTARPDCRISLPEIGLGLVPGAGGTVSLPRRIGRHRTALLALTGDVIDAATAMAWGLVDAIDANVGTATATASDQR